MGCMLIVIMLVMRFSLFFFLLLPKFHSELRALHWLAIAQRKFSAPVSWHHKLSRSCWVHLNGKSSCSVWAETHLAFRPCAPFVFLLFYLCMSISLRLDSWFVVLPSVSFAFAGGHHCDLVGPGAAILALELNPLGPGLFVHAAPVLGVSPVPELPTVSTDPVGQHLSRKTLSCAHQFFNRVYAGALAIWDVLCGSQLSAADWDFFCNTK